MIVLDASVMIAILDADDTHFAAARELFRAHTADRLVAHRLTMAETLIQAIRAQRGHAVAAALAELGIEPHGELDDPLELAELRERTGLKLPDSCVLKTALRERATLATFDARLVASARALGVAVVPEPS
ncbi:type II toxin-antitoxin system VapC family toxin [Microbacterium sp.]|uniref:type II toxin-antitoxin system VapC family toxin n=1 Tax=Microbacterium sp. TaxID=51671 RepID=UPI0039E2890B